VEDAGLEAQSVFGSLNINIFLYKDAWNVLLPEKREFFRGIMKEFGRG